MVVRIKCILKKVRETRKKANYKWLNRKPSSLELENEQLMQVMINIYEKVERTFGYRQLTLHMRKQTGKEINHKHVYRLMNLRRIQSVIRRKKTKYVNSTPQQVAENLLNREFQATAPMHRKNYTFQKFNSFCISNSCGCYRESLITSKNTDF